MFAKHSMLNCNDICILGGVWLEAAFPCKPRLKGFGPSLRAFASFGDFQLDAASFFRQHELQMVCGERMGKTSIVREETANYKAE